MEASVMKLTNEQLVAFTTFGLLLMSEPEALLHNMSRKELKEFAGELEKHLSPLVSEEMDMVEPVISILKDAVKQAKGDI
jgi:hypothetical protein